MKQNLLYILLATFIITTLSTCKKYPDDPKGIEWQRAKIRVKGIWEPYEYTIDGVDSLAQIKSHPCYGLLSITYHKDYGRNYAAIVNPNTLTEACGLDGGWDLDNRKKNLWIILSTKSYNVYALHPIPYFNVNLGGWVIRRLTEKELWLRVSFDGKEYFVKYNKIKDDGIK